MKTKTITILTLLSVFILSPLIVFLTKNFILYALMLPIPFFLFWWLTKSSKKEMGFQLGKRFYYLLAIAYPFVVVGTLALFALLLGAQSNPNGLPLWKLGLALLIDVPITATLLLITEEGIFRGLLWNLFKKQGQTAKQRIIWTSIAFAAWHISLLFLFPETKVALISVPLYLANAITVGMIWGIIREKSGSIVTTAISHSLWNTLAYAIFGFGEKVGMLNIPTDKIYLFDPERGIAGVVLNVVVLIGLVYFFYSSTYAKRITK